MNELRQAALGYIKNGLPVFPCSLDKKPLTENGFYDAITDEAIVDEWWKKNPSASIGVPTGHDFFVLDVDLPDGPETLQRLEKEHGALPETRQQRTGSGGRHYFFKMQEGAAIRNSAGKIGPGLDVRGIGGYVIFPPSPHPSGNRYTFTNDFAFADPPPWLVSLLVKDKEKTKNTKPTAKTSTYGQAALVRELTGLAGSPEGERNSRLNKAAFSLGQLMAGGELDQNQVETALLSMAVSIGLPENEVRRTIKSGIDSGSQTPRTPSASTKTCIKAAPPVEGKIDHDEVDREPRLAAATLTVSEAIEKVKAGDPGAVVGPVVVEALRLIKQEDRPEFVRLRAAIKKASKDIKISEVDEAIRGDSHGEQERQTADVLVDIAKARCTFFRSQDREPYATFEANGHRECWNVQSNGFIEWLGHQLYLEEGRAPTETATKTALATLTGLARYEGEERAIAVRVASRDGAIWLDLCNEAWQAVEVTAIGWRVVDGPPVMFVRSSSMRPLPMPSAGGDISPFWEVVNVSKDERLIALAWLFECLRSETPYAVLEFTGEQGSAKSSTQHFFRELIDPNQANLRAAPKTVEDVFIMARNGHVVSFENLSHLRPEYQDAMCVLATGGGFASRTLYTNADETVIEVKKPVMLNGIAVVVTAQDLLDRTVHIDLPAIERRLSHQELHRQFEENKAGIFGGLLDLFVKVLAVLPTVDIAPQLRPRMADFAQLGEAVYRVHGFKPGRFLADYEDKRREGVHRTLEASPVAVAALAYLDKNPSGYDGTVKGLYEALTSYKPEGESWPRSPKGFADSLRRIAPPLRLIGINAKISDKAGMHGYTCVLKLKVLCDISSNGPKTLNHVHEVNKVHAIHTPHEHYEHDEPRKEFQGAEKACRMSDCEDF